MAPAAMAGAAAASSAACSSPAPNPTTRYPVRRRVPRPPLVAASRHCTASPFPTTISISSSGLGQARPRDPFLNPRLRFAAAAAAAEGDGCGGERRGGRGGAGEALLRPLRLSR